LASIVEEVQKARYDPNQDNRKDLFKDRTKKAYSSSVVSIWSSNDVNDRTLRLETKLLSEVRRPLRQGSKFGNQPVGAIGTGFVHIVNQNVFVITAGHVVCYKNGDHKDLNSFRFLSGFSYPTEDTEDSANFPLLQVYKGKKIVFSSCEKDRDFAIVLLDCTLDQFKIDQPLDLSTEEPEMGREVFCLGHPDGLPLKIADSARILRTEKRIFEADLDAFCGNSGSPVFEISGKVIGILIRGWEDWEKDEDGMWETVVNNPNNKGEICMKLSVIKQELKILKNYKPPPPQDNNAVKKVIARPATKPTLPEYIRDLVECRTELLLHLSSKPYGYVYFAEKAGCFKLFEINSFTDADLFWLAWAPRKEATTKKFLEIARPKRYDIYQFLSEKYEMPPE